MREVFSLKAGNVEVFQTGTPTSVLGNGDFFEIRDHIKYADEVAGKKVSVIMLHSHPIGFENLSQDDIDTLIGMRLGLDRNFITGIVWSENYKLFAVCLRNKKIEIEPVGLVRDFLCCVRFNLKSAIKKVVRLSNYE